ncbi:hypothetical protein [Limnofasciculus baicalensis]|uniref:Uncharacterized protein n=1 Tax=Limnofasciculus baicalensis BBK-W-15 TaxID=2699891 RepID=A0AAE3GS63_9CYAN|nr:hypothetical protein [Limnofasciculus baicalensis]MCP2729354.1 hypothetical protein [Limnofasciculus baicalensis BBK-W-15]
MKLFDAAAPPSSAVETSQDFSIVQKDEQKIAGLFNLPKIPIPIPGVPSGNPLWIKF